MLRGHRRNWRRNRKATTALLANSGALSQVAPAGACDRKRPLYVQNTCTESTAKIKSATMSMRVAVLGGGVGGLSAAHELIERGFDVSVYERRDVIGGK